MRCPRPDPFAERNDGWLRDHQEAATRDEIATAKASALATVEGRLVILEAACADLQKRVEKLEKKGGDRQ